MTAESDPLDTGRGPSGKAHKGILRAAKFIQSTLKNMLLLQTAFDRSPVCMNDVTELLLTSIYTLLNLCYHLNMLNVNFDVAGLPTSSNGT